MDEQEGIPCGDVPGCDGQCCIKQADLARQAVVEARRDEMFKAPRPFTFEVDGEVLRVSVVMPDGDVVAFESLMP